MTIAIGEDVIDVLVHGPNRYFDNYRADPIPGVRDVYPFGYCGLFLEALKQRPTAFEAATRHADEPLAAFVAAYPAFAATAAARWLADQPSGSPV